MGCAGVDELVPVVSAKGSDEAGRMKFLCSHGGKILPKPDGQLRYVGGDTRLVSFNKTISFSDLSCKLEKLFGPNLCVKYQLPNEDLDTLISVTCDDDVENLVEEYDKNEAKDGASRLRAFLFPKAGLPVRDVFPCTCHSIEEGKGLGELKVLDVGSTSPILVNDCRCFSSAMFPMPDYLSGIESACSGHGCRPQHHLDGDNQLSPRRLVDDKGLTMKFIRPISPSALQKEYSRQQSSKLIDSGGRGPALTTSALGPLVSNHHQNSWDRRKLWDEAGLINQRGDEKWQTDASNEGKHYIQQDVINGVSMVRVSSKDRLAPSFVDVVAVDSPSGFDRQPRPHVISRSDLHSDTMEDGRQDGLFQGNARLYKPQDAQRVAPEIQWALPQSAASVFHAAGADSRRNSGDSDEGSHKAHSGADNVPLPLPVVIAPEGPHGVKMQEAYRHEEPIVMQHGRHGEYEVSASQYDPFHHLSKGHFQQVHWQLHDPQEPQQHPIAPLESVRVAHNIHGMQRHGQSQEYHFPPLTHHHHLYCASNNTRVVPRLDPSTVNRLPSPLYRQAATACTSRADPPSPRRGQILNTGSPFTSRHGVRSIQKHDMSYLPSSKAQHSSGLPSSQVFMNAMEQHGLYEQSGSQAHLAEKGSLSNLEPQAQYFDNVILTNQEGVIGQAHGGDEELQ
ncbi:hypothetical protein L7F22_062727 [Adiantum nelumboides]|nr:hypothetical protein [Adiantum nelumboides]